MAYDVNVKIDLTKPLGKVGFGVPLILLENAEAAVEYVEVTGIAGVVDAGFNTSSIVYKTAVLLFAQPNAPKQIAVCAVTGAATDALADAALIGKGWRHLIVVDADGAAAASSALINAVEALDGKMLFVGVDTDDTSVTAISGMRRTVVFYCDATEAAPVPVAALVGEIAGRAVGSYTCKNLVLSGILPQNLTDAQVEAIHKKGGITFVQKAGDNVTSEGKVAGGEYIDIIDNEDYIVQQLTYRTQKLLNNAAKIPYDNNGIGMLESVAVDVLQTCFNNGMIAVKSDGTPDYFVSYALREDVPASDRANRHYPGGKFGFALAGAIHDVYITGTITV